MGKGNGVVAGRGVSGGSVAGRGVGTGSVAGRGVSAGAGSVAGRGVSAVGANLLALRSHNTALVLDLLRTAGTDGISRLELADRTGLTPQAVSKIKIGRAHV